MYATTLFTFGCMNISGMLVFCFLTPNLRWPAVAGLAQWVLAADGTFSSCTGLNFLLCALSDCSVVDFRKAGHRAVIAVLYALVCAGFLLGTVGGWKLAWLVLYFGLTATGSVAFVVVSVARMVAAGDWAGIEYLVPATGVGLFGLLTLGSSRVQAFLCHWMDGYFHGLDMWYLESDFSLLCFALFYFAAHAGPGGPGRKYTLLTGPV